MANISTLFKHSFLYSIGNILSKLAGIILLSIYSIYTTEKEFGLISLFEVSFTFLLYLSGMGIKSGLQRWYFDQSTDSARKSLFGTTYLFNFLSSSLFSAILFTLLYFFSETIFQYKINNNVIIYFTIAVLTKLLYDIPLILLRLIQKASVHTGYQAINLLLTVSITFYCMQYKKMGFEGIFYSQMWANSITLLIIAPIIFKYGSIKLNFTYVGQMLRYGFPLAVSNVLSSIFTLSDQYIINFYQKLEEVGYYSVASRISNTIKTVIINSFYTSYSNNYYKNINEEDGTNYESEILTYFFLTMAFFAFVIVLFAKEAIYIIMVGETSYYSAVPLIPILIFGLTATGMRQFFTLPLNKHKKTKTISIISIAAGILNLTLNLIFIPKFGKIAAAITTAISQLIASTWLYFEVKKHENIRYETSRIIKIFLISTLFIVLSLYLPMLNTWYLNLYKLIFIPIYLLILYSVNGITKSNIQNSFHLIKKSKLYSFLKKR